MGVIGNRAESGRGPGSLNGVFRGGGRARHVSHGLDSVRRRAAWCF